MKEKHQIKNRSKIFTGLMLAMSGVASAATINVDGSGCNLVDAIESANTDAAVNGCAAGSGNDIIRLVNPNSTGGQPPIHGLNNQHVMSSAYSGTYVGTPIINSHITIEGEGQMIIANPAPDPFRVFEIDSGGTLILNNVTVSGGDDGVGVGSAVLNYAGTLEVNNSVLQNNKGAVVSVYATTSINQSTLASNTTDSYDWPTALFALGSYVTINSSGIVNNKQSNLPPLFGKSSFKKRVQNKGGASLPPTTILLSESESTLINSTISGNGNIVGAIAAGEQLPPTPRMQGFKKTNKFRGGPTASTTLSHMTIADNKGIVGGVYFSPGHSVTIEGSILSGNKSFYEVGYRNAFAPDASAITLDGNNFFGENGESGTLGLTLGASDAVFSNAAEDNLYPLNLSNGAFIHPLKHGSAAIDGLLKSCFQGIFLDQEGKGRGIDGDGNGSFVCDAGAFEHSIPIIVSGACTLHNAILSANGDGSVGGCQPGNGHDIIELPQGSTHTGTTVVDMYSLDGISLYSGLPVMRSGVVINANDSTIERDVSSLEDFNMLAVTGSNGMILNDATVTGATGGLAAVASWYGSEIQVFNSTITGNAAIGVLSIMNHNSSIESTTVSNNTGNANYAHLSPAVVSLLSENFELRNSLVANNSGTQTAAITVSGGSNIVISNNTISGNTGGDVGGIVMAQNTGIVAHNTVTNNSGYSTGGAMIENAINLRFTHNIISGNAIIPPVPTPESGNSSILSMGPKPQGGGGSSYKEMLVANQDTFTTSHNVIGENADSGSDGFTLDISDIVPAGATNTVIETTLADNGGMTFSHLPVVGSVAIDAGGSSCEENTRDQRNFVRPWDGDNDGTTLCDIGSVEANSVAYSDLIFKDGFDDEINLP